MVTVLRIFGRLTIFALKAVDENYDGAKRFAAAAFDKWLMYQGKPQKFGLQYVPDGVKLRLWDIDPSTTDKERADWDVPTLNILVKNVEEVNNGPIVIFSSIPVVVRIVFTESFFDRLGGVAYVILVRRRRKEDIKCSCHTTFGKWLTKKRLPFGNLSGS